MEAIKDHTNNQPQLIQWLCFHLWSRNQDPARWQITDELFHVPKNDQLAHRFQADFNYLSPQERRILWAVLHNEPVPTDIPSARRQRFLKGLSTLGYLRHVHGHYHIGNTFLLRWFEDNKDTLDWQDSTQQPSDEATLGMYEQDEVTESQKGRGLDPENEWLYEKMLELSQRGGSRELEEVRKQMLGDDWYNEWRKRKKERGANSGLTKGSYRKALTRLVEKAQKG